MRFFVAYYYLLLKIKLLWIIIFSPERMMTHTESNIFLLILRENYHGY